MFTLGANDRSIAYFETMSDETVDLWNCTRATYNLHGWTRKPARRRRRGRHFHCTGNSMLWVEAVCQKVAHTCRGWDDPCIRAALVGRDLLDDSQGQLLTVI